MKVKSLTIVGMHKVKNQVYNFKDTNYLYGLNGAGKSTVLQAIQLALLGYVPGMPKTLASIWSHANGPEMRVRVDLDDGSFVCRTWKLKGRSIESKVDTNTGLDDTSVLLGKLELPIFNFNELIGMTANKLKDWFIGFLPGESSDIDWSEELTDSLAGLTLIDDTLQDQTLEMIHSQEDKFSNTIDLIQAVNQSLKEEQTFLKSELKRIEGTIGSLVYYDDEDLVGDAESLQSMLKDAREKIQKWTLEKESCIQATQIVAGNEQIRARISSLPAVTVDTEALKARITELNQNIQTYQTEESQNETQIATLMQSIYQIDGNIKAKNGIISGQGICPYTKCQCDSIVKMIDQLKAEIETARAEQQNLQSQVQEIGQKQSEVKGKLQAARAEINDINFKLTNAANLESTRNELQKLLKEDPDMSKFWTIEEYTKRIQGQHERVTKITSNIQYSNLIDNFTQQKYRMENSLEAYKSWIKLTDPNGLQTRIMDAPFERLAEDITAYLQTMFQDTEIECKFNLEEKANSFSFGLTRGNKYISYDLLSSGEKTMYTLAMMMCIINRSESRLPLLIVDDMLDHLDDGRADAVFESLAKVTDMQMIVAGVKQSKNTATYQIDINS